MQSTNRRVEKTSFWNHKATKAFKTSCDKGAIGFWSVTYMDFDRMPSIDVSRRMLESGYDYEFESRHTDNASFSGLYRALKSVVVFPDDANMDMRWSIIFYDYDGKELLALCGDRWMDKIMLGNVLLGMEGGLGTWLNRFIKHHFV